MPREEIRALAEILKEKQKEYGHAIYLLSDEPYRELAFDGAVVPFCDKKYYDNTMVCLFLQQVFVPSGADRLCCHSG